ncbi:Octamer-binding transcription factor [Parasponia andersonii]|uniref:Octamer-binding transcription factor n=1 Tax=Parasponia andersonii TaxID=3476 RepID=A0A2P5D9Z3_PARAD|nr:Octamer-binding transcription factor [Parasponia andersonii]
MMAATLPDDEPTGPIITVAETKTTETVVEKTPEVDTSAKVPVHVMQRRFSTQKRLKKLDIQTLEYVYRRTKRPTNTMIDSIVHVTNLPRKRIVKWFEEKRAEEGVPGQRLPYQRSAPDAVQ